MPDKVDAMEIMGSSGLVSGVRGIHILDEEVAGELDHVFAVAFMRRRKKTRPLLQIGMMGRRLAEAWAALGCVAGLLLQVSLSPFFSLFSFFFLFSVLEFCFNSNLNSCLFCCCLSIWLS
jgi:hypothetical protein